MHSFTRVGRLLCALGIGELRTMIRVLPCMGVQLKLLDECDDVDTVENPYGRYLYNVHHISRSNGVFLRPRGSLHSILVTGNFCSKAYILTCSTFYVLTGDFIALSPQLDMTSSPTYSPLGRQLHVHHKTSNNTPPTRHLARKICPKKMKIGLQWS